MPGKRLLEMTWIGNDGEPYFTDRVSPRTARYLIARNLWARLYIDLVEMPLYMLTWAAVHRSRRCVKVKLADGQEILVDTAK
jgi:hypothetical protein